MYRVFCVTYLLLVSQYLLPIFILKNVQAKYKTISVDET